MRFLILIALLALVAVAAAERLGGPKAQLQAKPLQAAALAVPVNGTLPALNGTTANTTAASTTTAANTTEARSTEASTTVASTTVASTTVAAKT